MTTIYVLTKGEYSDYHIVALYSTRELAEEAQKFCPESNIEEYKLDSVEIPDHPPGYFGWSVTIDAEENIIRYSYQEDVISRPFEPQEHYCDNSKWSNIPSLFVVNCWARDKEHAEKIALDKYYQFKAQQAGI